MKFGCDIFLDKDGEESILIAGGQGYPDGDNTVPHSEIYNKKAGVWDLAGFQ